MKKYLFPLILFIMISLSSCMSRTNEKKLKKENDSLRMQLKHAQNEMVRLKDSVHLFRKDYSLSVNYNDPQEVAKAFLNALAKENFGAAKELGTENTAKVFGIIESLANLASDEDDVDIDDPNEITWGETIIKGKHAVCHYSTPDNPNQKLDLKLVNDQWKVDIKKEN